MKFDCSNLMKILVTNFSDNFKEKQFSATQILELSKLSIHSEYLETDARTAFRLSLIHGACYLDNVLGYSLKDEFQVFNYRGVFKDNCLIYVPGLYSRGIDRELVEGNSPRKLFKEKKFLFKGTKNIIFFTQNEDVNNNRTNVENQIYELLKKLGFHPENFILVKLFKPESHLEPFFEFIAALFFIEKGFMVENQVPWFQQIVIDGKKINGGVPDFGAYKYAFLNKIKDFIKEGMIIQELPFYYLFNDKLGKKSVSNNLYYSIIGEVKLSNTYEKQILKYGDAKLCNEILAILPKRDSIKEPISLLTINESDYHIKYTKKMQKEIIKELVVKDEDWLRTYTKMYLSAIIPFDLLIKKIMEFYKIKKINIDEKSIRSEHLLFYVLYVDDDEFLNLIRSCIKNVL